MLKCKWTPDHSCKFATVTIKNHRRVKTCQADNDKCKQHSYNKQNW